MGDVAGIFFHDYRSCTRQTRKAVFASRAAKDAMASSNGGRADLPVEEHAIKLSRRRRDAGALARAVR